MSDRIPSGRFPSFSLLGGSYLFSSRVKYFLIGLGGFLGTITRYWLSGFIGERVGETFPWGTLCVNVTGCLIIGVVAAFAQPEGRVMLPPSTRTFVMIGVLGGYTTFSSFSLQTLNLAREGDFLRAGGNILGSVIFCLLAVWIGNCLGNALNR